MRLWTLTATVLLLATSVLAHEGPPSITIKAAQKKQPPVVFPHQKHQHDLVKSCDVCHHTQKGLTPAKATATNVVKCTVCHLDPKKADTPSMREISMTKNPFHIRCIGCHKEQKKGPVVCTGCHKKTA